MKSTPLFRTKPNLIMALIYSLIVRYFLKDSKVYTLLSLITGFSQGIGKKDKHLLTLKVYNLSSVLRTIVLTGPLM